MAARQTPDLASTTIDKPALNAQNSSRSSSHYHVMVPNTRSITRPTSAPPAAVARPEDLRRSTRATTPSTTTGEARECADALTRLREQEAADQALAAKKTKEKSCPAMLAKYAVTAMTATAAMITVASLAGGGHVRGTRRGESSCLNHVISSTLVHRPMLTIQRCQTQEWKPRFPSTAPDLSRPMCPHPCQRGCRRRSARCPRPSTPTSSSAALDSTRDQPSMRPGTRRAPVDRRLRR